MRSQPSTSAGSSAAAAPCSLLPWSSTGAQRQTLRLISPCSTASTACKMPKSNPHTIKSTRFTACRMPRSNLPMPWKHSFHRPSPHVATCFVLP